MATCVKCGCESHHGDVDPVSSHKFISKNDCTECECTKCSCEECNPYLESK